MKYLGSYICVVGWRKARGGGEAEFPGVAEEAEFAGAAEEHADVADRVVGHRGAVAQGWLDGQDEPLHDAVGVGPGVAGLQVRRGSVEHDEALARRVARHRTAAEGRCRRQTLIPCNAVPFEEAAGNGRRSEWLR